MAQQTDRIRNHVEGDVRTSPKKLATTVYITEDQQALLRELNRRTRVPIAEYIREGIDLVLERHRSSLPGQLDLELDLVSSNKPS